MNLKGIWAASGTMMDDQGEFRGFVTITAESQDGFSLEGTLDIDEARGMALNFLTVAEAAEQDSIVFTMLTRDVGLEPDQAAVFVMKMREDRAAARAVQEEQPT